MMCHHRHRRCHNEKNKVMSASALLLLAILLDVMQALAVDAATCQFTVTQMFHCKLVAVSKSEVAPFNVSRDVSSGFARNHT